MLRGKMVVEQMLQVSHQRIQILQEVPWDQADQVLQILEVQGDPLDLAVLVVQHHLDVKSAQLEAVL